MAVPKSLMRKKSKEKEQTLVELNSAHRHLQAKCQLVQSNYIERIKLFLFAPYNKHLVTELSRSVWENLDLDRCVQTSLCSVFSHDLGQNSPIQTSSSVNKS